ncbi:Cof subfamily protein (haloacid dehalogenase superfamily) [Bacillus ectoiniformans]|uniref:Cof-type HAD-IIB family hydrolase n=1 Tax=Bacillus ectoiniformans TaxID=1494429 RepID=UPI0019571A7E|nr:Cof-type HAD-IIB family hydrolase [Bacillus ectoiniformans]MBM7647625.1 Cof subfamily protein (haloacid dehalogenase superfamily) [Bacillus ectoiniformans]
MAYRLVALSIDGALLQSNGRINKSTKDAIDYALKKNVSVCLYSSREYSAVRKVAKALKIDSALVAHQGAYIASEPDKPLYVKRILEENTFELVQFLESFDCQITLENEKFSVSNKAKKSTLVKRNVWQRTQKLLYSQYFVESLTEHLLEEQISPLKINVTFSQKQTAEDAAKAMRNIYDDVSIIMKDDYKMEITALGVSKWNGILYLAEQLGINRSEIAVIGSAKDDLEAVQDAGIGIAMGNADSKVKEAAQWVTRSNDENGVGYVIKELLRHQRTSVIN